MAHLHSRGTSQFFESYDIIDPADSEVPSRRLSEVPGVWIELGRFLHLYPVSL